MYRNNYRKLRPAQSGQPVWATDKPALQPQPPPKSIKESIFMIKGFCVGQPVCATNMPALRPQPPAKRNPGGIVTVKELNLRESVKLPPIFDPHNTERYPLASVYGIGVDLRKAELHRQERYDSYLQHSNVAQPINQEKSAVSERLRKAKNDRARCDAKLKPRSKQPIAPEATKAAQDLMRRTQEREEIEACESEVCDSDGESADSDDDVACQYMNFVADHERVLERYQREKEKIKEKMDAFREQMDQIRKLEVKNTKDIIHMKEQLQYLQFCKCDPITMRKKIRELCEKLSEFYLETLGRFCSPSFPYVMLTDLEEWLLQKMEVMSPERLRKIRKQLFKAYDTTLRKQKEAELEELRAERREKRRERAFAPPPPKITGKKLMPRSPPPKKVMKKEEPVKTKNQD